jgi:hypothetical protein
MTTRRLAAILAADVAGFSVMSAVISQADLRHQRRRFSQYTDHAPRLA